MTKYGYDVPAGYMGYVEGVGMRLFASYRDYIEYIEAD